MTKKKDNKNIKLTDFPEKTEDGLIFYGDTSYNNHIATLSHYLHNIKFMGSYQDDQELRNEMIGLIRDYLSYRGQLQNYSEEKIAFAADNPLELDLFHVFFDVPFPSPKQYDHTFIDLFAGIGGIRIPFDEMGYQCVFSSEWDAKACKTYFANFGTIPYGDITKIPAQKIPKHDVLLAGFPCQAFSIMGKMQGFADTRGTMFFEIERILRHHQTPYILLENVKQLVGHDGGRTFKVYSTPQSQTSDSMLLRQ